MSRKAFILHPTLSWEQSCLFKGCQKYSHLHSTLFPIKENQQNNNTLCVICVSQEAAVCRLPRCQPKDDSNLALSNSKCNAGASYLLHDGGGIQIPRREREKDCDIQPSSSRSSEARTQGEPVTQLELHTTLWQLYLRQEVVHTAHFNPSGVDSWALLFVCPQPWPARSSPHWLPAAARIPNPSLWQPPWSFFLNKPVHNNWELGRADNYFFFWDKISPAALVAKNGRGEVPDDLQYLRESHGGAHAKGVRWIGDEGTHWCPPSTLP